METIRNKIYSGILLMFMMLFVMCVPINAAEVLGDEDIIDWEKSTYMAAAGQNDTIEWHLKLKEDYQNEDGCPLRIYNFRIQFSEEEWTYIYPVLSEDGTEWVGSYELSDYGLNGTYKILDYSYELYTDNSDHTVTIDDEWGDCVVSGLKSDTDKPVIDLTKAKVYGDNDKIFAGDTDHFLIPASDAESGVRTVWFTTYRLLNETDCEYCYSMNIDVDVPAIERVDDGYVFTMQIEKPGTYMVLNYRAMDMCRNTDGMDIVSFERGEDGTYHYEKNEEYEQYFDQLTYTVYERQLSATSVDDQYRSLDEGEDTELKVQADCKDDSLEITYQWYIKEKNSDEWVLIENATESTYHVVNARKTAEYKCLVKADDGEEATVFYTVEVEKIDTGLSVSESTINVSAKKGERVELKAPTIYIYDGYEYSFQWHTLPPGAEYALDIDGQTKDTLVIDSAKESMVYYLIIEDNYGNSESVRYNFTVINDNEGEIKEPELVTLSDIRISKMPTKTNYIEGERFDKTGLTVIAIYSDGSSKDVTNKVEIQTEVLKMTDRSVVVRFEGKTAVIPISVSAKQKAETVEEKVKVGDSTTSKKGSYKVTKINEDSTIEIAFTPSAKTRKQRTVTVDSRVTIDGKRYPVTVVADNAFKGDTKVKTVKLPKTIKTIGDNTFSGCKNLTKVDLSKTKIETIGKNAFNGTKITTVKLPDSTTTIKAKAFANCSELKTITLGKNTVKIAENAFKGSKNINKLTFKSSKVPSKKDIKGVKSLSSKVTIKVPIKQKSKYIKVLRAAGFKGKIS